MVKKKPVCRKARLKDLDALMAIEEAAFLGDKISRRQMRHHLQSLRSKVWVCENRGTVAAYLLGFFPKTRAPRLYSLATHPAHRGNGFGSALLAGFLRAAKNSGAEKAILEVRADAPGTIALYERAGFTVRRRLPEYYEDGGDGLKMIVKIR